MDEQAEVVEDLVVVPAEVAAGDDVREPLEQRQQRIGLQLDAASLGCLRAGRGSARRPSAAAAMLDRNVVEMRPNDTVPSFDSSRSSTWFSAHARITTP